MLCIPAVQFNTFIPFNCFSSVHLRPACNSRTYVKHLLLCLCIFTPWPRMICKRTAKTDQRHIPFQNIHKLGQFINTRCAYEFSDFCHAAVFIIRINASFFCSDTHAAKFIHFIYFSLITDSILFKDHRTF